jgi:hypothetical protein
MNAGDPVDRFVAELAEDGIPRIVTALRVDANGFQCETLRALAAILDSLAAMMREELAGSSTGSVSG